MRILREWTENTNTNIETVLVLQLNRRERKRFSKHLNPTGEYVELPFFGMELTTENELLETGLVTLSHWTDKDGWYSTDQKEIDTIEAMLLDDLAAIKKLV